jgi:CRISPR-associated protein Cst1
MEYTSNIFFITGDPFVDTGVVAICEWLSKKSPVEIHLDELSRIIDDLSEIYVQDEWNRHCHGMLLPNHGKMFNPSLRKHSVDERKQIIKTYLNELANKVKIPSEYGNCIACGRRSALRMVGRSEYPLLGSGETRNFFSYASEGMSICEACLFAVQAVPVASYKVGSRILLLHSNNIKIMKYWIRDSVRHAKNQLLLKTFTGLFTPEEYTNPQNAMFDILSAIILKYDEEWYEENPSITFYYFTNNNRGGELEITYFPNEVFRFLAQVKTSETYTEWRKIIRKGYRNVKEGEDESVYKNRRNHVYSCLLEGRSIVRYFIDFKKRKVIGSWELLNLYLKEVRKMDNTRIEAIRNFADRIADYLEKTKEFKRVTSLEAVKSPYTLRNSLRIIEKRMIKEKFENPLFTFDEYVELLFPEGSDWRETLDLTLFRIYERLHKILVESSENGKVTSIEEVT